MTLKKSNRGTISSDNQSISNLPLLLVSPLLHRSWPTYAPHITSNSLKVHIKTSLATPIAIALHGNLLPGAAWLPNEKRGKY